MSETQNLCIPDDFRSWVLFQGRPEETVYLVGSLQVDKYLPVPSVRYPIVMKVIERLRAGVTPEQVEAEFREQGLAVNVREFCQMLARKKVIEWDDPEGMADGAAAPATRWASLFGHVRALSWQVFSIGLERYQTFLGRFAPALLALILATLLATSLAIAALGGINMPLLRQMVREILLHQRVAVLLLVNMFVMPMFVFPHEAAHAIAAAWGGVYPRRLSFRLYLFSVPYFSLQVPGLYTLPLAKRLLAIAAGPLMDLLLGNLCFLAARLADPSVAAWFALAALGNYGRLIFNLLPILPLTDGYALLSQAFFREIDIRGRSMHEFRRWRHKKSNNFRGKYVVFFILNTAIAAFFIGGAIVQLNAIALKMMQGWGIAPMGALPLRTIGLLLALDAVCLYLARNRLRVLLGA